MQFYSDAELPDDTKVISGSYVATHDYVLQARLEVPKASAAPALAALTDEFGPCVTGHPVPMETTAADGGLRAGQRRRRDPRGRAAEPACS